jgi:flagellar hook assembly protein FlgD
LYQNYPNPFNPRTTISFYNAKEQRVKIDIYNLKGQKVTSLLDNELASGRHNISWNAEELSSGIYFTKIKMADGYQKTIKMILMK